MFTLFIKQVNSHQFSARHMVLLCGIIWSIYIAPLSAQHTVKTGIEVLIEQDFKALEGMRVGLITNATGVNSELISTIDVLNRAENVQLVALYGPEHGVRGDYAAGDKVESYTDQSTGLPVYSLYGATRKPTKEMLEGVDVLVYDIQDIGVRSYTYISTMGLAMEAAAELGIPFVVLDRPNPLGGLKVEGGLVEPEFESFVSAFPIPYVYGLTPGEVARMMNDKGWMDTEQKVDLTVISMEGWTREMTFEQTGLPWVPTSPHIPHAYSSYYYVTSGIMGELGVFSEGVGYTLPFQTFAADWIDEQDLSEAMNALGLPGVYFRPIVYKPFYGRDQGKTLRGVQIHLYDFDKVELMPLQFYFMQVHQELYPEKDIFGVSENRWNMFDKVNGSDQVRLEFLREYQVKPLLEQWRSQAKAFQQESISFWLYPAND